MKVRIVSEDGITGNAKVMLEDGTLLVNCANLLVTLDPRAPIITAQATFLLPKVDILAHVTISEEHLFELAAAHGYELKRRSD